MRFFRVKSNQHTSSYNQKSPDSVLIGTELKTFDKMDYYFGKPCYGSGHLSLIIDFYDCVKNGKRFDIDGKEASKVIKMILAVYKSKGEKIKI